MRLVINRCFGGFGLSDEAYEKLIEWGVPVRAYIEQERDQNTGRYLPEPANDGRVIFDRTLYHDEFFRPGSGVFGARYWDTWLSNERDHHLLVRVVEELGDRANSRFAELKIVEIPDGVEYEIAEYEGFEHVAEKHRTWP